MKFLPVLMDLAPITPAMEFEFFIRDNLVLVIAGVIAVVAVSAALIIKAIKKKK